MKYMILLSVALSTSAFASNPVYHCSVSNYHGNDGKNYVNDMEVVVDGKAAAAVLPATHETVTLSIKTFKTNPADINQYGQYALHAMIGPANQNQSVSSTDATIATGGTFIGLQKAIQFMTTSGQHSTSLEVGIQCNLKSE